MTGVLAAVLLLAGGTVVLTARPSGPRSRLDAPVSRSRLDTPVSRSRLDAPVSRGSGAWLSRTALWWRAGGRAPAVAVVSGAAGAALAWGGPVAAVFAATYGWLAVRGLARRRVALSAERGAAVVEDLVTGLAADLRAGLAPGTALEWGIRSVVATEDGSPSGDVAGPEPHRGLPMRAGPSARSRAVRCPGLPARRGLVPLGPDRRDDGLPAREVGAVGPFASVLAAASTGGDVAGALRELDLPGGRDALTRLAAAWDVADSAGAPLAGVLDRLDADLVALRRRRTRTRAETAAASATVRMLALLPLLGLGLGYTLGADPLGTLLHSAVGSTSAMVALGLQAGGLLWAERLAAAPERSPP